ncbi:MAG TPA: alpha/beta hydrolase [Luteibacter sp.]|jgi:pimeloyl-ACP methyl ester carboxylesterase|nr:alpha/beta hydrolase [Luteibacter sp.]
MKSRPEAELPFYFGANDELFGLFHAALAPSRKAVLLCPPLGQDQIRCHRLYRQLAGALAADGIPVLRFDYYGSGDSAGASAEVDWDRCLADAVTAADELRTRSGAERIVAFGARIGGSVALAAARAARFSDVVAWDPVLDGDDYVARLDAMQAALRVDGQRFTRPRLEADVAAQWLGFAVSDHLRGQLAGLRLDASDIPTLVLDSLRESPTEGWHSLVADNTTVRTLRPPTPWNDMHRLELAILSHPLIQAVTGHVREVA